MGRGNDIYLVGGSIRDELLGRPCDDWDMVCRNAGPVARSVAKKLRAKCITLDEQHRIYRVILPSPQPSPAIGRERSEATGEGVRTLDFAELQGRSIEEDLGRRDFTINAMAKIFPDGVLIDPFHGRRDLQKKVLRAVSEKAFLEDPLRLVRAFRFSAQFRFSIESRTLRWIQKHRLGLSKVAAERIREELLRMWKQPDMHAVLRQMDRVRLLSVIFPEVEACRRTALRYYGKGGVLKHSFETVENLEWILNAVTPAIRKPGSSGVNVKVAGFPLAPAGMTSQLALYLSQSVGGYPRAAWLKWGAFLHDFGKPATAKVIKGRLRFFEHEHVGARLAAQVGRRLRLSRQEVQLLELWVRNHMRLGNLAAAARITDKALSRFFRDLGEEGVGMVLVSLADHYTYLRKALWGKRKDPVENMGYRLLSSYYEQRSKILPERVVDGHMLMRSLKIKPGPLVGKLLEAILDAQAEGKVTTKEQAIAFAKSFLRRHPGSS
jgi:poly(A) polymerase